MNSIAPVPRHLLAPSLGILVGIHLALDLMLISRGWLWGQSILLLVLAVPLSQLTLLTLWATVDSSNSLLRLFVPIVGIVACWFLMSRILPWGTGEAASAGWAMALVVQATTVFIAVKCAYPLRLSRPAVAADLEPEKTASSMRFGVGTLMLWMTVTGLGFGFVQFGQFYWQWTTAVFQWELLGAMPIIGLANGLLAALWCWVFASVRIVQLGLRVVSTVGLTAGLAVVAWYSTKWATGTAVLSFVAFVVLLAAQSFILAVSLSVVKLGGAGERYGQLGQNGTD